MSIPKFTQGDWSWGYDDSTSSMIQVDSDVGCAICRLQGEGNANLIAAAPEMYAMLESIRENFGFKDVNGVEIDELLAKARGES